MRRYLLYILALIVAFSSCSTTDFAPGNIDIEFQFETLPIDLNIVDNPFITCIVRSETGLEKVQMMIEMNDGELVPYKTDIREFFNPRHCSIHERPVYTEDMVAFIVRAVDLGGAIKEGRVTFEMTSKVNAPVIYFTTEGISFAEGESIPEFGFTVSSDADLASVSVQLVESATSSELLPLIEEFEDIEFNGNKKFIGSNILKYVSKHFERGDFDRYISRCECYQNCFEEGYEVLKAKEGFQYAM